MKELSFCCFRIRVVADYEFHQTAAQHTCAGARRGVTTTSSFFFFTIRLSGILLLAKQQTLVHTETPFFPPFFSPLLFFPLFVRSLSFCLCSRAAPLATLYMYLERILEAYLYLTVGLLSFCLLRLKLVCTLPKRGVRRQTTTTKKREQKEKVGHILVELTRESQQQ